MKVGSAEAFLACLDLQNQPREALQNHLLYEHIHASFIGELPDDIIVEMQAKALGNISLVCKELRRNKFVVMSATLWTWYDLCITVTDEDTYDLRLEINSIVAHLEKAGFKIFTQHTKKAQPDGTFILWKK
jgi:hypothetical protein